MQAQAVRRDAERSQSKSSRQVTIESRSRGMRVGKGREERERGGGGRAGSCGRAGGGGAIGKVRRESLLEYSARWDEGRRRCDAKERSARAALLTRKRRRGGWEAGLKRASEKSPSVARPSEGQRGPAAAPAGASEMGASWLQQQCLPRRRRWPLLKIHTQPPHTERHADRRRPGSRGLIFCCS